MDNRYRFFFNPPELNTSTKEEMNAMSKARSDSKAIWNRIGWNVYKAKALEAGVFGNTVDEVGKIDTCKVLEYFNNQNAMII